MTLSEKKRNIILNRIIERIGRLEGVRSFDTVNAAKEYGVTIQTVYRYLRKLEKDGRIIRTPEGRGYVYTLSEYTLQFELPIEWDYEHEVWNAHVESFIKGTPECAYSIIFYIFTEIINNVKDHSEGTIIKVFISKNEYRTKFIINDNGVGIFSKIAAALNYPEKRFAVLELAKGRFTTDPTSHTGEGIFFSSKAADIFVINADGLSFASNVSYTAMPEAPFDYLIWDFSHVEKGTEICFIVYNNHSKPLKSVFDEFVGEPDDYGFDKTAVPVKLVEFGNDNPLFISRSQAKRLLARFEEFKTIILDFSDIEMIGQGFADEVFRIFPERHPGTKLTPVNCSESIRQMIARVSKK